MKKVLCITLNPAIDLTATVNELTIGAVNRATDSQLGAAGKGLNVARLMSELGQVGVATGFLGDDNRTLFDRLFASHQSFDGIYGIGQMSDEFVSVQGMTRTNVKIVDKGKTTDVNGVGFSVTQSDKDKLFSKIKDLLPDVSAVVVAGSMPRGFDADDFRALLDFLTTHHDKVAVDVSGAALKVALDYDLWLIKPNLDELSEVVGRRVASLDEQQTALQAIKGNITHMLVSMGSRGVNYFKHTDSAYQIYQALPPKVSVASSVGAGDTMVAAMMFGLLQGYDDRQLLTFATALSAYAVTTVAVGVPSRERLDELTAGVTLTCP